MKKRTGDVAYYESDSPCRRCGGVTRYRRPPEKRGACLGCEQENEERDYLHRYIVTGAPKK